MGSTRRHEVVPRKVGRKRSKVSVVLFRKHFRVIEYWSGVVYISDKNSPYFRLTLFSSVFRERMGYQRLCRIRQNTRVKLLLNTFIAGATSALEFSNLNLNQLRMKSLAAK